MRSGCLLFIASAVAASPLVIKVRDEAGRPLSEAMIRVVTAPADDPRLSSVRELTSVTDERGDATIVTVCHHGMRSMRAAAVLRAAGLGEVRSLAGGVHLWAVDIAPGMPTY